MKENLEKIPKDGQFWGTLFCSVDDNTEEDKNIEKFKKVVSALIKVKGSFDESEDGEEGRPKMVKRPSLARFIPNFRRSLSSPQNSQDTIPELDEK